MASTYVEGVLTGRWGPDQQTLAEWGRLGYDVRKVMRFGLAPLLQLHP